ncbi:D-aminoacid aminotransferase-like PLP-dependent enzyme [Lindgomyces ingoldianus]|uniref:D-aminoacid aminotransferase-like PLP-dependent enzyme n=1 Tax=Lindgomyces ingoldianus TaxID=673940 RepID=A0ACB6QXJ5_9PLEO|nr:D-aminoacid aminotransferase-like PLP-dependent enzyme [Lindgomyces ingoldianus]KAF2471769.1 D-aminoacid aminotransferase-like PLP-dependent enzyme [Lindgomyces ingoldianus]
MSPIALTPPVEENRTSDLTLSGIEHSLQKTAPSVLKSQSNSSTLSDTLTNGVTNGTKFSNGVATPLAELDASLLNVTLTTSPRPVPEIGSAEIASQKICTDHMIQAQWTVQQGWSAPSLQPYGPLSLMPTASCLHYATECFEGMKLYRGFDGKLRLFRPELNCNRMLVSTNRIALPGFPPQELLKLIVKLCATDGAKWLPKSRPGAFLYIRPTMIASDPALGVQRPKEALLFVILTCFPPMDGSPSGLRLLASKDDMVRAWPGGFGYAKVGANYGPSLVAQGEARAMGYDQILWLFGENCNVTEAGASNFFVVWRTREGALQLVTAPLSERIILDGITRRSVLELARTRLEMGWEELEKVEIVERKFSMMEIEEAVQEERLIEAFAAGTAFFIAPVGHIHFRGMDLAVPMKEGEGGAYTRVIKSWLKGIMWGNEEHEWGYVIDEDMFGREVAYELSWVSGFGCGVGIVILIYGKLFGQVSGSKAFGVGIWAWGLKNLFSFSGFASQLLINANFTELSSSFYESILPPIYLPFVCLLVNATLFGTAIEIDL